MGVLMKYARTIDQSTAQDGSDVRLLDVIEIPEPLPDWAATSVDYISRIFPDFDGFIQVADDAQDGDVKQNDGSFKPAPIPDPPQPQPHNPGNPYFGKIPMIPKLFWSLVLQTYIAIAVGDDAPTKQANGLDRQGRLLMSKRAQGIIKVADAVDVIDTDDRDGDFLKMATLLTTTLHEDGQLIIEVAEFGAIMQGWKNGA